MATPTAELRPPVDGDLVRSYLRDIGRVPLLSHEQEITLGRQVQELVRIEEAEEEMRMRQGEAPSKDDL
ncbi:sigma-70 factor domain-containing protein, partial [Synechococcus sp. UW140]